VEALDDIRARHTKPLLVVAHADVIKVLIAHYVGLPLDLFQRLEIGTASVSVLSFGKTGSHLLALNITGGLPEIATESDEAAGADESRDGAVQAAKVVPNP
jgi:probable phosphoglycerate mutase